MLKPEGLHWNLRVLKIYDKTHWKTTTTTKKSVEQQQRMQIFLDFSDFDEKMTWWLCIYNYYLGISSSLYTTQITKYNPLLEVLKITKVWVLWGKYVW